jgi:hypothetical protein
MKKHYHNIFDKPDSEKTISDVGFGQLLSGISNALKEASEKEDKQA